MGKHQIIMGIILGIANSILVVLSSSFVKLAADHHNAIDLFFYRSIGVLIMSFVLLLSLNQLSDLKRTNHKIQILRSTLGSIKMILAFLTLTLLPIAQAQLFMFLSPILIVILSYPVLKERVGRQHWFAVIIGLIGAAIILQPGILHSPLGVLSGLGVTIFYGASILCLRFMGRTENPNITVFYFAGVSTALCLPFIPFYIILPTPYTMMLITMIILSSFAIQLCLTFAYKFAPAAVVSPLIYLNLIWALFADFILWQEVPNGLMLIGALVIITANLGILWIDYNKDNT